MAIKLEYKSKRSNTLELKLGAYVLEGIEKFIEEPFLAESYINDQIPTLSTGNAFRAEYLYKAFLSEDYKTVEVWHLNSQGDKDRLVAVITKT